MSTTIIAMYDNAAKAEKVVNEIVNAGISRDQVEVLSGNGNGASSLIGKLSEQGVEKDEAAVYAEAIGKGRSMVTVQAPDERADETFEMMNDLGAQDLDELLAEAEASQEQEETEETVPVVEEQVSIGKRKVMRGGVRVTSTVSERPVEETLRLREEKVEVEQTSADRKLSPQEAEKAFAQKTVELAETAEEAVISKEARVVEEVSLRKSTAEREETVQAKARRTDVKVEELEAEEPQQR
ncbi:MAG: YsnF/AvaK domain-containing protein [Rhodospirillales bacterium]|nr:YsnF/AvaK domain-containing protein [Rhodospirillales bacterium]